MSDLLESEEQTTSRPSRTRSIAAPLVAVLVLVIVGGVWWLGNRGDDPSKAAAAGASTGPSAAATTSGFTCWNGETKATRDACGAPSGMALINRGFAGITTTLSTGSCVPQEGAYIAFCSFEQLGVPAVQGVYDADSSKAVDGGISLNATTTGLTPVKHGCFRQTCKPWRVDGTPIGTINIERATDPGTHSWKVGMSPKGTIRVTATYAALPLQVDFFASSYKAAQQLLAELQPLTSAQISGTAQGA